MATKTIPYVPYKIKDISLAKWGEKEIELACLFYKQIYRIFFGQLEACIASYC